MTNTQKSDLILWMMMIIIFYSFFTKLDQLYSYILGQKQPGKS